MSVRLIATECFLKKHACWPKRNPSTGEFVWPLEPDPAAPWSISCDDMRGVKQKRGTRPKARRQLRFTDVQRLSLAKRRGSVTEPLEILIQPEVSCVPAVSRKRAGLLSASKAAVCDERDEGTSTSENYTIEDTRDGKMVRRIVSLHSWQTFRADSVSGCVEQMEGALNMAITEGGAALSKIVIDETKAGFLKPEWQ